MHKWLIMLSVLFVMCGAALAQPSLSVPDYIHRYLPNAQIVGQGRLNYLVWNVYDATLYAAKSDYEPTKPFALSMYYLRNITGKDIADKTIEEIRRQGFSDEVSLAAWHEQLRLIFPDVQLGTVLTGVHKYDGTTLLLKNGNLIGKISDPEFGHYFFNIWLGKGTSAPQLRQKLLGKTS